MTRRYNGEESWNAPILPEWRATDLYNAERMIAIYGRDLRYVHLWRSWLHWDGHRWVQDETGGSKVQAHLIESISSMVAESRDWESDKRKAVYAWGLQSQSRSRLESADAIARKLPGVSVVPDQLDADPFLLNTLSGAVDLRTGTVRVSKRDDLCTRVVQTTYDPSEPFDGEKECPIWIAFLDRIMGNRADLVRYLQIALGYTLTGVTSEKKFFFLYGPGGDNGKSTFVEVLQHFVGDYGKNAAVASFMVKRDSGMGNDIARLKGARFVTAPETGEGQRIDEDLIKRLTGGDTITARFMYQDLFEFRPEFKVWISGNHKPEIRGTDPAIWRRVVLIPFEVTIPKAEQDPTLKDKLIGEAPGILRWMIEGSKEWWKNRLPDVQAITEAVQEYRAESDTLGKFLGECTEFDAQGFTRAKDMYARYVRWARTGGEYQMNQTRFGNAMRERGEGSTPHKNSALGKVYKGRVLAHDPSEEE